MKLPLSWLKEWVPVRAGAEEIAKRLTFAGLEIEGILEAEGDFVLEVNVTPNRGDCLSVRGLAREISALYGAPLKAPYKSTTAKAPSKSPLSVSIARPKSCPRYALAVIDGVRVGASPAWLVKRLAQVGVRSVNNLVDVTNFVLFELGHPLHAFDRSKLRGGKLMIRNAKSEESFKTLDGMNRKLLADDLVIADAEGPVALAGVMGGANSEVDGGTSSVAIECAYFDPATVRRASRRLGLVSDSSFRFERGVDPEGIPEALNRAVALVLEVAGGNLVASTNLYPQKVARRKIRFQPAETATVLGGEWPVPEIRSSLVRLGFEVKPAAKGEWQVTAPSYRGDVVRSVDLIEEIARLQGLDRVPEKFPALSAPVTRGSDLSSERKIKTLLADLGLQETIHYSFVSRQMASLLGDLGDRETIALSNPLSQEDAVMRPSLLPSLLSAASLHDRHKIGTLRIFELRNVFRASQEGCIDESKRLAGLLMGSRLQSHWSDGVRATDFYDLKGVVQSVLETLSLRGRASFVKSAASYLHPGQQAEVHVDGRKIGVLGEAHPDLLARFDLKKNVYLFELDWSALTSGAAAKPRFKDYPRTPVVERDLALVVEEGVEAGALLDYIRSRDPVISEARVFDLYRGSQVPAGKKSLAFSLRMSRPERTLTDGEVNEVFNRVVEGLKGNFQAEIR